MQSWSFFFLPGGPRGDLENELWRIYDQRMREGKKNKKLLAEISSFVLSRGQFMTRPNFYATLRHLRYRSRFFFFGCIFGIMRGGKINR